MSINSNVLIETLVTGFLLEQTVVRNRKGIFPSFYWVMLFTENPSFH